MGPGVLSEILSKLPKIYDEKLIVGYDTSDDAAVYKISDDLAIIQTVDFFPPMVDDPFVFGQIAATNAISDVYAMGAVPTLAMNLLCVPNCLSLDIVEGILAGGYSKAQEAGILIAGGHTIEDVEPKYGMCVTGFAKPNEILANSGAKEGEVLVLTKPIGTGVLSSAFKCGDLNEAGYKQMVKYMTMLNSKARNAVVKRKPSACTDVTGFGLMGHAYEMATGSKLTVELFSDKIPLMDGVLDLAREGYVPGGTYKNMQYIESHVSISSNISREMKDLLFDPQTAGGLLVAIPEKEVNALLQELEGATVVGRVLAKQDKDLIVR